MSWWKKLTRWFRSGADGDRDVDYFREGVQLLEVGKYHDALISLRLALREDREDTDVMQHIAIAYTRMGVTDEAIKTYQGVLERKPDAAGAHYGLAFLLLREGRTQDALPHLRAFLRSPAAGAADEHVQHARRTLAELTGEPMEGVDG